MKRLLLGLLPFFALEARIHFEDLMTEQEMQRTGVANLTPRQKEALGDWIDENFYPFCTCEDKEELHLSLNIGGGSKLGLSDGRTYEVAPDDRIYSSSWITPFPIEIGKSGDPEYPVKITNLSSETSVRAKEISTDKLLEKSYEEDLKAPPPKKKQPTPKTKPVPKKLQ